MATRLATNREFPWTTKVEGDEYTFSLMEAGDRKRILDFTQALSKDDMMFLRMDISDPEVVDVWINNIENGDSLSLLLSNSDGEILGYCTLHIDSKLWTSHIGEMRFFVAKEQRGIGLSSKLVSEIFQIARDQHLERLTVNIAREQPHVQKMLERLGFKVEALLTDWLKDRDGVTHDLIVMSHHLIDVY